MELEGAKTRLAYLIPAERSPLEVLRNYEDVVKAAGGQILFSCKGDACGGDPHRSSAGGGGDSSLMMYFVMEQQLKDTSFSNDRTVALVHVLAPKEREQKMVVVKVDEMAGLSNRPAVLRSTAFSSIPTRPTSSRSRRRHSPRLRR
jgi:OmpA-OmpF porin, OOP family